MTIRAFQRMGRSVLALLGEEAFLRGDTPCKVNIEHNVEVSEGDLVYERSVATVGVEFNPAVGDDLRHPDGHYRLDRKLQTNGSNTRFIVLEIE